MVCRYLGLKERLYPCLRSAEDQGVDIVHTLIGIDGLQIGEDARHVKLVRDSVAPVHVARHAGDVARLAAAVALHAK